MASALSYLFFEYSMEQHGFWIVIISLMFSEQKVFSIYSVRLKVQKVNLSCTRVNWQFPICLWAWQF